MLSWARMEHHRSPGPLQHHRLWLHSSRYRCVELDCSWMASYVSLANNLLARECLSKKSPASLLHCCSLPVTLAAFVMLSSDVVSWERAADRFWGAAEAMPRAAAPAAGRPIHPAFVISPAGCAGVHVANVARALHMSLQTHQHEPCLEFSQRRIIQYRSCYTQACQANVMPWSLSASPGPLHPKRHFAYKITCCGRM